MEYITIKDVLLAIVKTLILAVIGAVIMPLIISTPSFQHGCWNPVPRMEQCIKHVRVSGFWHPCQNDGSLCCWNNGVMLWA